MTHLLGHFRSPIRSCHRNTDHFFSIAPVRQNTVVCPGRADRIGVEFNIPCEDNTFDTPSKAKADPTMGSVMGIEAIQKTH